MPLRPCWAKLELRSEQGRIGIDERGAIAFEQFGRRKLAVAFGQFGLVVEQLQMARCAGLEQVDDALGLRGRSAVARRQRVSRRTRRAASAASSEPAAMAGQPDSAIVARTSAGEEGWTALQKLWIGFMISFHEAASSFSSWKSFHRGSARHAPRASRRRHLAVSSSGKSWRTRRVARDRSRAD